MFSRLCTLLKRSSKTDRRASCRPRLVVCDDAYVVAVALPSELPSERDIESVSGFVVSPSDTPTDSDVVVAVHLRPVVRVLKHPGHAQKRRARTLKERAPQPDFISRGD